MTTLGTPSLFDLAYVAAKMRDDEKAQWCAMTGFATYDADIAARTFASTDGPSFCLYRHDGMPLVVAGLEPVRPGVFQTWMAGTPDAWSQHWLSMTKHCRRLFDSMFADGTARRIQTYALESRRAAHVWYARGLLLHLEGVHRAFFADGQNAVCYARTVDDWRAARG